MTAVFVFAASRASRSVTTPSEATTSARLVTMYSVGWVCSEAVTGAELAGGITVPSKP